MCSRRNWQSVSCCGARLTNTWPDRKRFVFTEFRSPNGYYRAAIGCTAVWTFSVHCVSSLNKSTVTCGDEIRSSGQGSGGGGGYVGMTSLWFLKFTFFIPLLSSFKVGINRVRQGNYLILKMNNTNSIRCTPIILFTFKETFEVFLFTRGFKSNFIEEASVPVNALR